MDVEKQVVHVGGGALWSDVDKRTFQFGLATVCGTVSHVSERNDGQDDH